MYEHNLETANQNTEYNIYINIEMDSEWLYWESWHGVLLDISHGDTHEGEESHTTLGQHIVWLLKT